MNKCLYLIDTNEPCTYDTTKEYCDYFGTPINNNYKTDCPFYGEKIMCDCGFPQSYPEPPTHSK